MAALATVSAGYDAAPLRAFAATPPDTVTLLLVRHGSAGDRDSWVGDDDERPLDDEGTAQAAAMADVLPLYEPRRVLSAPLVRCVDTVRPLAVVEALVDQRQDVRHGLWRLVRIGLDLERALLGLEHQHRSCRGRRLSALRKRRHGCQRKYSYQ